MNRVTGAPMPQTSWGLLVSVRDGRSAEAWDRLIAKYWKPIYKYVRLSWRKDREEAQDLTQAYLAVFFEKGYPDQFDPNRGRFRTFLRASVDNFLRNVERSSSAQRRGGAVRILPLSFEEAEMELASASEPPGSVFDEEWIQCVLRNSLDRLRQSYEEEGRANHFAAFRRTYVDEERTTYRELADEFGIKETDITNFLNHARSRFRRFVEDEVRDTVENPADFDSEIRELLGA